MVHDGLLDVQDKASQFERGSLPADELLSVFVKSPDVASRWILLNARKPWLDINYRLQDVILNAATSSDSFLEELVRVIRAILKASTAPKWTFIVVSKLELRQDVMDSLKASIRLHAFRFFRDQDILGLDAVSRVHLQGWGPDIRSIPKSLEDNIHAVELDPAAHEETGFSSPAPPGWLLFCRNILRQLEDQIVAGKDRILPFELDPIYENISPTTVGDEVIMAACHLRHRIRANPTKWLLLLTCYAAQALYTRETAEFFSEVLTRLLVALVEEERFEDALLIIPCLLLALRKETVQLPTQLIRACCMVAMLCGDNFYGKCFMTVAFTLQQSNLSATSAMEALARTPVDE
uniref:Uncharacterized protein n=1 Tax=Rhodosorus marinus TaxID=101924 RepID=A0A7S0BU72_9RHOD|mmetsp:Transcript_8926/g.13029  ORF Transcript_8926/g.13029 Transcript_8926/m.13029 type:complete len:350 (+) Transcript_8926:68-1117(+)